MTNPEINSQARYRSIFYEGEDGSAPRKLEPQPKPPVLPSKLQLGDWALQATCSGEDLDIFFPDLAQHEPIVREQIKEAKSICADCPVQDECLDYALENHEDMLGGIFGGLTFDERSRLLRRRRTKRPQSA